MGTIVIHAGMPKTGSTSVQRWIAHNAQRLRETDVFVLVARPTGPYGMGDVRLQPYDSGPVNSGRLVTAWFASGCEPGVVRRFLDDLASFADRHATVLVTAEALAQLLWRIDETFTRGIEQLGLRHRVRVAYYVRPQHSAIEANWCEGGYKQGSSPSDWVREHLEPLHYLRTLDAVTNLASTVAFEMRPFRRDLLDAGSVVTDFAGRFLGLADEDDGLEENPGLPLQLVNMLRCAPAGMFWNRDRLADAFPRRAMWEFFEGTHLPESPAVQRSRLILRAHCHQTFEPENQELIRRLEWDAAEFVPTAPTDVGCDLSELDALWTPDASDAELELFHRALFAAMQHATHSTVPATRSPNNSVRTRVARAVAIPYTRVRSHVRSLLPSQPGRQSR